MNAFEMALTMKKEERMALFDTGIFNGIVQGYLISAMERSGFSGSDIASALRGLRDAFDMETAEEALANTNKV